jgi:hypothetical protein
MIEIDFRYVDRKKRLNKATKELAVLLENHFDSLGPAEREAAWDAFHAEVVKIRSRDNEQSR